LILHNKKCKHSCNIFVRSSYTVLKSALKPMLNSHPRVKKIAVTIKCAVKKRLKPSVMSITNELKREDIPSWIIEEWKSIHLIEPSTYPDQSIINSIHFYDVPNSRIGKNYIDLCRLYGSNVSHVFLVPFIIRGGADLVVLNYINALVENGLASQIVVIQTIDRESVWRDKLPQNVKLIEFGEKYCFLTLDEQEKLLTRLLIQMTPKVIHNIQSDLGYRVYSKYGKALSAGSNLFVSIFLGDETDKNRLVGYPYTYLPRCFDYLRAVFCDNQIFLDKLEQIYGFDKEKLIVHYSPIKPSHALINSAKTINKSKLNILWAGRFDFQKRPDILLAIAKRCRDLPFIFHVYGESTLDRDIYTHNLKKLGNVILYGSFDGFFSLPLEKFDVFLFTSQFEGIPTVIIGAMLAGIPVIASDVGGISELVKTNMTGYLINPYDDVTKYVDALQRVFEESKIGKEIVDNAFKLVESRHSWDCFVKNLKAFSDYIVSQPNKGERSE
jgi:glycosyltransferase involved in cell wall biosynthesis